MQALPGQGAFIQVRLACARSVVEARFPAQLEAVSQGLGDRRTVAVFVKGHAPLPAFDETLRAQGEFHSLAPFSLGCHLGEQAQGKQARVSPDTV